VFDHRDYPEAGTQVPAGTVDANESGMVFACRFVPFEPKPALIADDAFLEHL
jgi:hypothetical protein